jgi:hypothetical protein
MTTFNEIFWWYGVTLFTAGVVLFYGTLLYCVFAHLKGLITNKK